MISQKTIASWMICFLLLLLLPIAFSEPTRNLKGTNARAPTVQQIRNKEVIVDNGIVRVTFSNPEGLITGIKYNEIGNILNPHLRARGYWDITWQTENNSLPKLDRIEGTNFRIITQNEEQVEISFSRTWNGGSDHIPLNVDKRYIIRTNTSGIYTYGIFERQPEWPEVEMGQIRVAFKLNPDRFHYMVVADNRQRQMPTDDDRDINSGRAKPLAYKEAVQLTNPHNQMFKNQVDDKYQYSCEVKDNKVHGWISTNSNVGFWLISPSGEYRSGGPVKQELTSHVGPTTLTTFISQHYVGPDMETWYKTGEAWKKVLGPVFIYLNSDSTRNNLQHLLWEDAKRQAEQEVEAWPYGFVASSDFPTRQERGTITGRLFVNDRFLAPAGYAYIGLAPPGEAGSWQTNTKGYQFWTQTNETGYFTIDNVRPGTYNLYGWVHGFIGDFKYQNLVNVAAGSEISLDRVVFQPPRNGPTLWEIGVPDRTAREYFVPEPYENTMNPLYLNHTDKFRQYGLWQRYTELYPNHDLVYTVGVSNYSQDWFYAHVTRNIGGSTYVPATWQIVFELPYVNWRGSYTLQIALASAARANLKVRFNNEYSRPLLSAGVGRDNAIARHGIHGAYHLYSIDVPGRLLRTGTNTIYLRQSKAGYQFWTQTNETGYFTIDNVRPGTYNLYGWVHGFIGDFKYQNLVNVAAGSEISLDRVVFQPPRNGPTLWEIGVPDRTAREYFVPEPYENTMNPLYLNHTDKFRQYGLWQRYTELYPNHDLVYTVGVSNYSQDWFYAHVTRNIGGSTYVPTTWQIVFELPYVNWRGSYTLQIALSSAARANLQVRFNNEYSRPLLSAGVGRDNAIARHGIHGAYHLYSIDVPGRLLRTGTNTIYLRQSKAGYQFWTQTNETGYFTIDNVRPGTYNLYGWVHGFIGDFKYQNLVNVAAGSEISLDRVVFQPPRNGPTLWEIGVPDRTAREYFVPEPYENTMNPLYLNHTDKFRQYGLWQRYTELYPNHDLVYTVGVSNYSQDWFYAHVTRNIGGSTYVPTTWQIVFELPYVNWRGSYTLQIALSSAARANLQVRFNNEYSRPLLSAGVGRDNAIARHGIHGAYHLYSIDVPGRLLRTGTNTIYLRQSKAVGPFEGLMYDYIRLEEPSTA
uniref:rhamnogalacturonan endolyase n=1 Tax=Brassica campestris TaxID=3711 RepID=A0A3P6C549_BRACM|nr:unnamed protein product [Brassica rapa]